MRWLYFLIAVFSATLTRAQTNGDLYGLSAFWSEDRYAYCLRAAREDGDSARVLVAHTLRGAHLVRMQDYVAAERVLNECVNTLRTSVSTFRDKAMGQLSIYDCYDYLGRLYGATGNHRKAEYYLSLSNEVKSANFSEGSSTRIMNKMLLGGFYLQAGNYARAETLYLELQRELRFTRLANGMIMEATNACYIGLTKVSLHKGDLKEAKLYLDKAYQTYMEGDFFDIFRPVKASKVSDELKLLRAQYQLDAGQLEASLGTLSLITNADSVTVLPGVYRISSAAHFRLGRYNEGIADIRALTAIDIRNIHTNFYALTEIEKETLIRAVDSDVELAISFSSYAEQHSIPFDFDELLILRLRTKGLILNSSRNLRQALAATNDDGIQNDFRRLRRLRDELSHSSVIRLPGFSKAYERRLDALTDSIAILERSISGAFGSALASVDSVNLAQIRDNLPDNSAAVEIIRFENRIIQENIVTVSDSASYLAFVLTRDTIRHTFIRNGNELEKRYAAFYKNSMLVDRGNDLVYQMFWGPLAPLVGDTQKIIFSPDGVYNTINLNTISDGDTYLIDRHEIALVGNLQDILKPTSDKIANSGTAYFFARPDYANLATPSSSENVVRSLGLDDIRQAAFADLEGTEVEVRAAEKALKAINWNTKVFLGQDAQEKTLVQQQNPSILHLATHGFFIGGQDGMNPMLQSGLIFSGINSFKPEDDQDGILTSYEASTLDLQGTSLVVLSACETGLGEIKSGEGVYGLQRAFLIAGADRVIISLWKVDDKATSRLMSLFYEHLSKTHSIRQSFSEAQKKLRQESPSPYYWGAFMLSGY
jgi:CHAT domain-containing protein/tetratricopeptide (TPR) repeat protein